MESILVAIGHNGVTGVCTAVEASAQVILGSQDVDQLALAFVAPLGAEDDCESRVVAAGAATALLDKRFLEAHLVSFNKDLQARYLS